MGRCKDEIPAVQRDRPGGGSAISTRTGSSGCQSRGRAMDGLSSGLSEGDPRRDHGRMPGLVAVVRRLPLTTGLVAVVLLLAIVTRALWDPLVTRPLGASTTYGLPVFESGSWWTVVTGAFFAAQPLQYMPILFGLMLFGGFAEWRLGTRRCAIALVVMPRVGRCSGRRGCCGHPRSRLPVEHDPRSASATPDPRPAS